MNKTESEADAKELLQAAREAFCSAAPPTFSHHGRTYWLRFSVGIARVEIFDNSLASDPMLKAFVGSVDTYGHVPTR